MEKVVIVKGVAGLGNRLITAAAAISYAKINNRKVYIDWSDGFFETLGTNAFYSLFETHGDIFVKEIVDGDIMTWYPAEAGQYPNNFNMYDYFRVVQINNRYIRKLIKILKGYILKNSLRTQSWESLKTGKSFPFGGELNSRPEDVVIFADYVPRYNPDILRNSIVPAKHIREKINKFVTINKLYENAVGVHIRNTDKKSHKTITTFVDKLKKYSTNKRIEKIFLATDDPKVEVLFKDAFGTGLVTYPKFLPEVEKDGIHHFAKNTNDPAIRRRMAEESVIDMFLLSKVNHLFYQKGSTFSEISKVYHEGNGEVLDWTSF